MEDLIAIRKLLRPIVSKNSVQLHTKPVSYLAISILDKKELIKVVTLLKEKNISFKVQSQGKNWGYTVIKERSIIINLHKLNQIYNFNEELGYISIEPGVTFEQVYTYLKKKKSTLMISVTGGPPRASVIATTLERGVGKGRYGNLFEYCSDFEVLLPTGDIISTGFSRFENAKNKYIHKWANGPFIDGLFSQSNFGIITKMTIFLKPKPLYPILFTFSVKEDNNLQQVVEAIRFLKMHDIIQGNFLIANQYRLLTEIYQYPWIKALGKTPLPKKNLKYLSKQAGIKGKWTGQFLVHAFNKEIGNAHIKIIKKYFSKYTKSLDFITQEEISLFKNNLTKDLEKTVFLGYPHYDSLKSLYWRKKIKIPKDINPDRDQCGIKWFNAVLPMDGKVLIKVSNHMEHIMYEHGFEPNIGFNFITERAVYLIGSILYDKGLEIEEQNAAKCYNKIYEQLFNLGYYSYRGEALTTSQGKYASLLKRLEKVFNLTQIIEK